MIEATVYCVAAGWDAAGLLVVTVLAVGPLAISGVRFVAGAFIAKEAVQYASAVCLRGLLAMPPVMFLAGYIFGPAMP